MTGIVSFIIHVGYSNAEPTIAKIARLIGSGRVGHAAETRSQSGSVVHLSVHPSDATLPKSLPGEVLVSRVPQSSKRQVVRSSRAGGIRIRSRYDRSIAPL